MSRTRVCSPRSERPTTGHRRPRARSRRHRPCGDIRLSTLVDLLLLPAVELVQRCGPTFTAHVGVLLPPRGTAFTETSLGRSDPCACGGHSRVVVGPLRLADRGPGSAEVVQEPGPDLLRQLGIGGPPPPAVDNDPPTVGGERSGHPPIVPGRRVRAQRVPRVIRLSGQGRPSGAAHAGASDACRVRRRDGSSRVRHGPGGVRVGRGSTAGPSRTAPSTSKRDPWHGQSQLRSAALNRTRQPRWVQRTPTACRAPSSSR